KPLRGAPLDARPLPRLHARWSLGGSTGAERPHSRGGGALHSATGGASPASRVGAEAITGRGAHRRAGGLKSVSGRDRRQGGGARRPARTQPERGLDPAREEWSA